MKEKKLISPFERMMTVGEIAIYLNVEERTVTRWGREGTAGFPPPLKLNNKTIRWREIDIEKWMKGIQDEQRKSLNDYSNAVHAAREEREQAQETPRTSGFIDELCGNTPDPEQEEPSSL